MKNLQLLYSIETTHNLPLISGPLILQRIIHLIGSLLSQASGDLEFGVVWTEEGSHTLAKVLGVTHTGVHADAQ